MLIASGLFGINRFKRQLATQGRLKGVGEVRTAFSLKPNDLLGHHASSPACRAGYFIHEKSIGPTARRFEFKQSGRWPLTCSCSRTQPDGPDGLGYVNCWTFGPKSQKLCNIKTVTLGLRSQVNTTNFTTRRSTELQMQSESHRWARRRGCNTCWARG